MLGVTPTKAGAEDLARRTSDAQITDTVYFVVKGLKDSSGNPINSKVEIGLFGKDAPQAVSQLKQLASPAGLPAPCRPKAQRSLQKEQLEANKVYASCMEGESDGVSLRYSQIWRVVPQQRIDVGAVAGKFVARQYPGRSDSNDLRHDQAGVVSVLRGSEGGFGFCIYPGGGSRKDLDEDNIVVGRVTKGMDVVEALNSVPIVTSSKLNYMSLTGANANKAAPDRSCRYGGPMYCNENKPLIKLSIIETGVV